MNEICLRAYAKVNLGLDVIGRRPNGYHDVRMVMQNIDLFDKVTLRKSKDSGIFLSSNLTFLPTDGSNLVYKAIDLLKKEFGIETGVEAVIFKFIPVAAGMAGGSADAAAALVGMNRLFELGLSAEELMIRGEKLGADVPYCIMGGTVLAEGIGEILTALKPCPDCFFVVAKPPFGVSTKYVYENLKLDSETAHPDIDGILEAIESGNLKGIADRLSNVLESVTATEYPDIAAIEDIMKEMGALGAIMSGSGPTIFGMFDDEEKAEACNLLLRKDRRIKSSYVARNARGGF